MRYEAIDPELFEKNRRRLVGKLKQKSIAVIHANDVMPTNADGTMPFQQNRDLFYLTGVNQEESILVLWPDAPTDAEKEVLFVRKTSELLAIWEGEKLTKEQGTLVSGIENVQWLDAFDGFLHRTTPQVDHIYLHTNEHLRAGSVVETRNRRFISECQDRYPLHRYERIAPLMHELRTVKDEIEVNYLQTAIDITEAGFRRALEFIKPGVGEWEIEAEYLHEFVRRRSRGFAYGPIIGSGSNACILHYLENNCVCEDGELVLMDVGAEYANWNADMTRTVPVNGRFSERQRAVYNAVLSVMKGANQLLRPGILPLDYQNQVLELMEEQLIGLGLIDAKEAKEQSEKKELVKNYFMHGTSHHLGLDVHDVSPPNAPVSEGMVFTIEPGIYIRDEGLGVRIENNVFIGDDKNIDLFADFPTEVEEIEEVMNP